MATTKLCFILLVVLISTLDLACCQGQRTLKADIPVGVKYYKQNKNLDAYTIILDVNSLYYKGNHPYFYGMQGPDTDTAEKCALRCAGVTGCNAFVSCPSKTGCGAGCKAWVKKHPALTSPKQGLDNYIGKRTPLLSFGGWTYPAYGLDGCANTTSADAPKTGDKWGWGLCTLKKIPVTATAAPKFFPSTPKLPQDGFVSGILTKPPGCPKDVPYYICGECSKLKTAADRYLCFDCASSMAINNPIVEAARVPGTGSLTYDYCPRCFRAGINAGKCISCLKKKNKSKQGFSCLGD